MRKTVKTVLDSGAALITGLKPGENEIFFLDKLNESLPSPAPIGSVFLSRNQYRL
jgi:hypothetical protein